MPCKVDSPSGCIISLVPSGVHMWGWSYVWLVAAAISAAALVGWQVHTRRHGHPCFLCTPLQSSALFTLRVTYGANEQ